MAATTAGVIVLRGRSSGKTRAEKFTMTPTDGEFVTFSSNNQTHILTLPEGEDIVDMQFNNDGVTTVNMAKLLIDGSDIRNRYLMAFFAADNAPTQRVVSPIGIGGGKQLQISVHA